MTTHYSRDGKNAYDIEREYPECPIKRPKSARTMTSARLDFESTQDAIIKWYEENILDATTIEK